MIKIVLGSTNKSKKAAIEKALNALDFFEYEILCIPVDSKVSSKPIDEETLMGAQNRNAELLEYCKLKNINYDMLISIEGGYEQVGAFYFLVTYVAIYDAKTKEQAIGKSQGLPITQKMFEWIKSGKSLNKVIEDIAHTEENKKENGISGYLTKGYYYRSYFDSSAIIIALEYLTNIENYHELEKQLQIK
jgi:inosine/xanthosine triphosphatase